MRSQGPPRGGDEPGTPSCTGSDLTTKGWGMDEVRIMGDAAVRRRSPWVTAAITVVGIVLAAVLYSANSSSTGGVGSTKGSAGAGWAMVGLVAVVWIPCVLLLLNSVTDPPARATASHSPRTPRAPHGNRHASSSASSSASPPAPEARPGRSPEHAPLHPLLHRQHRQPASTPKPGFSEPAHGQNPNPITAGDTDQHQRGCPVPKPRYQEIRLPAPECQSVLQVSGCGCG